jgi:hypothetical protein
MDGDRYGWSSGPGTTLVMEVDGDSGRDGRWENKFWGPIYAARQVATRSIWLGFCSGGENSSGMEEEKKPTGTMATCSIM